MIEDQCMVAMEIVISGESAIKQKETNNINWGVGDKVNHKVYGFGVVLSVKGQLIDIAFKDSKVGVKTMMGNHASLSKE